MLYIYVDKLTNRLGYTINLIFKDLLQTDYMVTTSKEQFCAFEGAKLSYSENIIDNEIHIYPACNMMFETSIFSLEIDYVFEDDIPKIFRTYGDGNVLGFDIFCATFYMVSRYEEYLPFIRDKHLRFSAKDSIAYNKGFLDKPVVNIWAEFLKKKIAISYPNVSFHTRQFHFINTIDIDQAYCYKHKGLYGTIGGFAKSIMAGDFKDCIKRLKVLLNLERDSYDCFDYILNIQTKYKLKSIFFCLLGMRTEYDKNISPYNTTFRLLIKNLSDVAEIGIHPSYYSIEYPQEIASQIKLLSSLIHRNIYHSRFHYLRFSLPQSYDNLISNEIEDEYSMGYPDCIGFRAGICTPYSFYDLDKDCETKLRIHPFMFMDVALKNGMNLAVHEATEKINMIIDEVKKVNGELISIWHNESLSNQGQWKGWREVYEKQLKYINENK